MFTKFTLKAEKCPDQDVFISEVRIRLVFACIGYFETHVLRCSFSISAFKLSSFCLPTHNNNLHFPLV